MVFYCCVPLCKNISTNYKMHRFPKDQMLFSVWITRIKNSKFEGKEMNNIRTGYRICDIHFANDCRIKGRWGSDLRAYSIPSLHLPHYTPGSPSEVEVPTDLTAPSTSTFHVQECSTPTSLSQHEISSTPKTNRAGQKRRTDILKSISSRNVGELIPKARRLHRMVCSFRETAKQLDKEHADLRERLQRAYEFTESPEFIRAKLNEASYKFVMSQLKFRQISPKARRLSIDDKILALSLLKQSPKGYKLLRKIFAVPSRKTLTNSLTKVPFDTGINEAIINVLKSTVEKMKDLDKYCTIMFDEISLDPSLLYNEKNDFREGFQDNGDSEREPVIADKAMVFMARGIHKEWKQPLSYYFNEGGMKKDMLAKTIKAVVRAARSCGLKVIATVCDQGSPQASAIQALYKETEDLYNREQKENRNFGFEIDGEEVVPLYDPPHLLKGIRNALFDYDVSYTWRKGKDKVATWRHIKKMYELEDEDEDYKLCRKLTEAHINNTKKMEVNVAAQIFSAQVAAAIKSRARHDLQNIPAEAVDTAEFVLFMDKAFDSVNGASVTPISRKLLRTAVSETSGHCEFWTEAIKVFQTIKFFNDKKKNHVPPSVQNWIHTLKGFQYIWSQLKTIGFKYLCPRNFNQDPLENFFELMRSHGVRNVIPNRRSFVASFKSLIINNYMSPYSTSANCENDNLPGLDSLRNFLTQNET